jgi:AcrR family transcriptional regulator
MDRMTTSGEGRPDGRRSAAAARRRAREQEIIAATRAVFDERGVRDAQIEDIARAVGINRAIVYRHFTGKEELFALTLVGYLDELRAALADAAGAEADAADRLAAIGRGISSCLATLSAALESGVASGDFAVEDPTLLANTLYASGLGALQLARVGILVKEAAPGIPTVGSISAEQVKDYLVKSALALAAA